MSPAQLPKANKSSQASLDTYNQNIGRIGESVATTYLKKNGYTILKRNFKARYGELDIVCSKDDTLIFVEVKTRMDESYGLPEESVTPRKLREVVKTAQYFQALNPNLPDSLRIDVIGIILFDDNTPKYFNHIENVTL